LCNINAQLYEKVVPGNIWLAALTDEL